MALTELPQDPATTDRRDAMFAGLADRPYFRALRAGTLDLGWYDAKPGDGVWGTWGVRAPVSRRGLTLMDADAATPAGPVGGPGSQPRGAGVQPGSNLQSWDINDKHEVWSDNLQSLYEEACSRQWHATADIDWAHLELLPPDQERALCQFMTFLSMAEYLVTDAIAPWIPRFNTYFHEIKLFMATQAMDEARHTEVFRKRLHANGGGLGMAISLGSQLADGTKLFTTWEALSYAIHVVFEGAVLSMFRFGEFLGQTDVDKQLFRMVMQDEARHVSYGTMHLKYLLEHSPDPDATRAGLHAVADGAEAFFLDLFFCNPATIESCAVLAGGGVGGVADGLERYQGVYRQMREEYLLRTERAGLDRRGRCWLPESLPF
jgi:hypothetical protein